MRNIASLTAILLEGVHSGLGIDFELDGRNSGCSSHRAYGTTNYTDLHVGSTQAACFG